MEKEMTENGPAGQGAAEGGEGKTGRTRRRDRSVKDTVARTVFLVITLVSVVAVFAIIFYVLYGSIPAFREIGFFRFLFGTEWLASTDTYGVGMLIVGTLALTACALVLGGLFGVVTAVWTVFYCPERLRLGERYRGSSGFVKGLCRLLDGINFRTVFNFLVNILAGIPSIVFGLFAYKVVMPLLTDIFNRSGTGTGLLPAAIILSIMILPTVASLFRNSLERVPREYYEGALALGATKSQAVWRVMVPAAGKGMVNALILGMGRAIGETMAVQMIVGNGSGAPGWFTSFGTLTSNIVKNWGYGSADELHRSALIADGFVLLVLVLIINLVALLATGERTGDRTLFGGVFSGRRKRKERKETRGGAAVAAAVPADGGTREACQAVLADASAAFVPVETLGAAAAAAVAVPRARSRADGREEARFRKKGTVPGILCGVSWAFAAVVAFILVYIVVWVFVKGIPGISWNFLFGQYSYQAPTISAALVSTLMLILLALVISIPLGVGAAIFLNEYCRKGSRLVKTIDVFVDTLAGVPSIIFGIFGYMFLVTACGLGYSLWAGGITLAIMVLPTMIRSTEQALSEVPDSVREASYALGAGKVRTIFRVVLPQAMSGIITAVILSIGRILSESAALIFTAGSSGNVMPTGYGSQCASLSVMIYLFMSEGIYFDEAYATAAVVLILVIVLNLAVALIEHFTTKRRSRNG